MTAPRIALLWSLSLITSFPASLYLLGDKQLSLDSQRKFHSLLCCCWLCLGSISAAEGLAGLPGVATSERLTLGFPVSSHYDPALREPDSSAMGLPALDPSPPISSGPGSLPVTPKYGEQHSHRCPGAASLCCRF